MSSIRQALSSSAVTFRLLALLGLSALALPAGCAPWPAGGPTGAPGQESNPFAARDLDPARFPAGATGVESRPAGIVRVTIAWPAGQARKVETAERAGRGVQAFPATTATFEITVTAVDMVPVTATVDRPQDAATVSAQLVVPAGAGRSVDAQGLNAAGLTTARGSAAGLTVSAGLDTKVTVQLATVVGDVAGHVAKLGSGQPAAGVGVAAAGASTTSDAAGDFLLRDVAAGTQVLAYSAGGVILTQPIVVSAGTVADAQPVGVPADLVRQNSGTGENLAGVLARSATEAFAWSGSQILRTTDGGQTWGKAAMAGCCNPGEDLHFGSAAVGYGVGSGRLFKTTDGGSNWFTVNFGMTGYHVHAFDAQTVLTMAEPGGCPDPSRFNLSFDGGNSVGQCRPGPEAMHQVSVVSQSVIWSRAEGGSRLWKTLDGGANWAASSPPGRASGRFGLSATDASNALVVGDDGGNLATVAQTVDGGGSWTVVYKSAQITGPLRAIAPVGTGYCAVGPEMVVVRYPGATSWSFMSIRGATFNAVSFAGTAAGWAVGDGGIIYKF